jgi:hypothetical protein
MRNIEKERRSAASNLLVQFLLAELTLQLAIDPSKSRRSIPARADGRSQQKTTVDPSKSRRLIPTVADQIYCRMLFPGASPDSCGRAVKVVSIVIYAPPPVDSSSLKMVL